MADVLIRKLEHCARCGLTHENVLFQPLSRPVVTDEPGGNATHWSACPENGEPILLGIANPDEDRCEVGDRG